MRKLLLLFLIMLMPSVCYGQSSYDFEELDEDFIDLGNSSTHDVTGGITQGIWVKHETVAKGGSLQQKYITKQDGALSNKANYAWQEDDSAGISWCYHGSVAGWRCWGSDSELTTNTWYYLSVTFDESTDVVLYKNGVALSNETDGTPTALPTNTANVYIGSQDGSINQEMDGLLSMAFTAEAAYSQALVAEMMWKPEFGASSVIFLLPLWDLNDISGNGLDGTNNGAVASNDGPPIMMGGGLPL